MRKICVITVFIAFFIMSSGNSAFAAIPEPAPRPAPRVQEAQGKDTFDSERALKELRAQYPNLKIPASSDVQWIGSSPKKTAKK